MDTLTLNLVFPLSSESFPLLVAFRDIVCHRGTLCGFEESVYIKLINIE